MLKADHQHNVIYRAMESFFRGLDRLYKASLGLLVGGPLRALAMLLILLGVAVGMCVVLYRNVPSELAPTEDRGGIFGIAIAPEGATTHYTDSYVKRLEQIYPTVPEVNRWFVATGVPDPTMGINFIGLVPWGERKRTQMQIVNELFPQMFMLPGVLAFPSNLPSLGQDPFSQPIQFVIKDSLPYAQLDELAKKLIAEAAKRPDLLINVDSDLKLNKPQFTLDIDRDRAADAGVGVDDIGRTVETLMAGRQVTRFKQGGKQYDVIVKVENDERTNPDDLSRVFVRSDSGEMLQLSGLAKVNEGVAPKELIHYDRSRSVTVTAIPTPGSTIGESLAYLDEAAKRVLPETSQITYGGQSREFRSASASLIVTFLLAIGFIYLVLSAQFESFIDPFIIMLTVPLSIAGALLALWLTGNTLNIYSQIGIITLIGLITKNGILIVEFANQLRDQGRSKRDGVIESAALRLRPILMTTGAMVLGAIPLAFAQGAGNENRHQIGWVIVGGLLLGTLFTLYVVPAAYLLISRSKRVIIRDESEGEEELAVGR